MSTFNDVIAQFTTDAELAHQIVHGDASTTVTTDGGPVRSMAKLVADNQSAINTAIGAIDPATLPAGGVPAGAELFTGKRSGSFFGFSSSGIAAFTLSIFTILIVSGPGAAARTVISKLLEQPVSPEDFGATGDGVTDDTTAFAMACLSARRIRLSRGKTYLIRNLTLTGVANFELDGNGATIVSDQVHSILGFSAAAWGTAANIYVHDLTLYYANNPNARTDNIFPLWFQFVNGVTVERVTITNSWSAGIIYSACSNIKAYSNKISNTLADGMTCFGCGRNVTYFDNDFTNTADDAMAVTWLAGNTAAAVGETTICTKGVRITGNRVNGTTVSARGVFIGGVVDGTITLNQFYNVAAFSILISNTTTVANYSTNVVVAKNTVINSGQAASSLVGEVGGIAVYSQNLNVTVKANLIVNANNVGMLLQGNVYADGNVISTVTNTPSTQNPSLAWQGVGAVWADFSASNTCYGSFNGNQISNTVNRAVSVGAGYNTQYLSICDNEFHDCVDPVAVGTAALGIVYLSSTTRNQVVALRNKFFESRTTQVVQYCVYVAGGGLHDIDEIGINIANGGTKPSTPIGNASGGTAIKRFLQAVWNPGGGSAISQGAPVPQNWSVADANLRDQVIVTAPYQIPLLELSGFVQSANTVTSMLACVSSTAQTPLGSNTYTIRVRRQ